ncbi:alcohol dehydrogenase catalytic domain-containing protein [Rhodococcus opacus]|nr:alcohol dehydrogenase catalytic domain-containing protein [Rhodococcus opacus]
MGRGMTMSGDTLRACVVSAPGEISVREFPIPNPPPAGGLLDVEACGVCGSDIELFRGEAGVSFDPLVLGHEVVGRIREISEVSAEAWSLAPGDRVIVNEVIACGACRLCLSGASELCNGFFGTRGSRHGFLPLTKESGLWGGYADVMQLHPRSHLVRITEDVPTPVAAMFMPISNGIHWVFGIGGAQPGDTLLVIGPGAQGLAVTATAHAAGLRVIVAGRTADAARLALARAVGAVATVDVDTEDVVAAVNDLTGGVGADIVVVATSGADDIVRITTRCVKVSGTVLLAGTNGWKSEQAFKADALVYRDLTLRGVIGHSAASVQAAARLLESSWRVFEPLVGSHVGLDDVESVLVGTLPRADGIHISVSPR